jgi:hypothetical protein
VRDPPGKAGRRPANTPPEFHGSLCWRKGLWQDKRALPSAILLFYYRLQDTMAIHGSDAFLFTLSGFSTKAT